MTTIILIILAFVAGLIASPFVAVKAAFSVGKTCGIASGLLIAVKTFHNDKVEKKEA